MKKSIVMSIVASSMLFAGAYKIPEQSINSMALGAAYIAHTTDADTAYFNPANMSFLIADLNYIEGGVSLAHLPSYSYEGQQVLSGGSVIDASGKSEIENLPIPYAHFVMKAMDRWRFGLSATVPAGLTKRWESPAQKLSAQEFTLKNIELNPVVSYRVSDTFSVGGGVRMVYSEGVVKSDGNAVGLPAKREMEGDTIAFGYNLALAWKPTRDISVGVTYRSTIDLDEEGEANLYLGGVGRQFDATVTVPIPAALNIGISKTWQEKLTVELVYERTFWSDYETLDFEYGTPIQPLLVGAFDDAVDKSWDDTSSYKLGVTYHYSDALTLMGGYAYDETPVPQSRLSYELPDSDAHIFSGGFKYKQSERLSWGVAVLYDKKESQTLKAGENRNGIIGEFSDGGAVLGTVGLSYKF